MKSPISKVIGSFLLGGASWAVHCYAPPTVDNFAQMLLLQLALHYGVTFAAPKETI